MVFRLSASDAPRTEIFSETAAFARLGAEDHISRSAARLLVLAVAVLVVGNLVLAATDRYVALSAHLWPVFDMSTEGSLSERYLQGICLLTAVLFAIDAKARGSRLAAFFALLYGFVWVDDTALYHETAGTAIAQALDLEPALGLRAKDFGEVLAWLVAALPLTLAAAWSWRDRQPGDPGLALLVGASFALLVLFGLVVDMIHMLVPGPLHTLFGIVEDGGETLAISLTAVIAVALLRRGEVYRAQGVAAR